MRLFQRNICTVVVMMFLVLGRVSLAVSDEPAGCLLCGMYLPGYSHVRYTIVDQKEKKYVTCGVQCGLLLTLNLQKTNEFKSATMTDLLSHKAVPSEKGWYVFKSSLITDMAPGLIGFADKSQAEKFIIGFGGEVFNYQQALDKAATGYR
jgi:DeoR family transcriptional regulator, copper-sensing transcriptional repressor